MWSGQTVSRLGDSIYRLALAWWVLEKTGSAVAMGTVLIFSMLPLLLFVLIGGMVVDRVDRKKLMLFSDLLRGLAVAIIAWFAFARLLEVWHIYLLSILFGLVDAFFQPAYSALVPEVVLPTDRPSANSLTSMSAQVTGVVGPAVGAAIVAFGGTPLAFALDAGSFIISAACILPMVQWSYFLIQQPSSSTGSSKLSIKTAWKDILDGLKFVAGSPFLWITISIASLSNITLSGPTGVGLPFLVKDHLHAGVGLLGALYSLFSVGSVIGAIYYGSKIRLRRRGLLAYFSWIIGAGLLAFFGLNKNILLIEAGAVIMGFCFAGFEQVWVNSLQELVPNELLGRVTSLDYLGSYALLPVGYAITGWAIDRFGASQVFFVGGLIGVAITMLGLLHPAVRHFD
ncbi:MAG TPA: MFS transporter [Anaerolineaceae bacterium]|nr:MFS transporter [Anaerolineaceae bacterium]